MIDPKEAKTYPYALMSAGLPETLDAWRALAAKRSFDGVVPLLAMPRLCAALERPDGECRYALAFDRGELGVAHVEIRASAQLPVLCQRSLQRFLLPVEVVQKLALVDSEGAEAELPEGYEALLVGADGMVHPLDLVEDELILALPVVPVDPASDPVDMSWPVASAELDEADSIETANNPFAVLADFKSDKRRDRS